MTCFRHCIFLYTSIRLGCRRFAKCKINIQIYLKYPPTSLEVEPAYIKSAAAQILIYYNLHNGKLKFLSHTLNLGCLRRFLRSFRSTSHTWTVYRSRMCCCKNRTRWIERAKKKKNARCQVKRTMLHNIGIVLWPGESLYSNWPRLHTRKTDLNAYTECKNGKVGSSYCTQRAPNHLTQKNVSDLNVCDAVFRSLCSSLFFFFFSPTMDKTPEHQRKLNALKLKAYAFRQMPKYALRIIKWQYAHLVVIYWIDSNMQIFIHSTRPRSKTMSLFLWLAEWNKNRLSSHTSNDPEFKRNVHDPGLHNWMLITS